MFGWSKKKEPKKRRPERSSEENEFGIKLDKGPSDKQLEAELRALAGVDGLPEDDFNLNEGGEEDEETELLRLIGGGKGKRPAKKPTSPDAALGDITADITADIDEGDEDVEVDENDEELLGELMELTQPEDVLEEEEAESESEPEDKPSGGDLDIMGTLKERLKMYKTAEAKAKEGNESSRARRFSRGIKTIEDLIKKAKAGKPVSPNDIPPVIALNLKPAPPVQPEMPPADVEINGGEMEEDGESEPNTNTQSPSAPEEPEDILTTLMERLKLYKTAEEKAKEGGETTRARRFNRGIKTLEGLIRQAKAGKPVPPGDIPPAVALNLKPAPPVEIRQTEENEYEGNEEETVENEMGNINLEAPEPEDSETKEAAEPERNIMDVLSERLQMYKKGEAAAKEAGETTRARRFNRGVKTIQDLIRQATAGKPIPPEDIPPVIALNLKPAPPVVAEEPRDSEWEERNVERDDLVRSADTSAKPLAFSPVDDIDLDQELMEEDAPTTVLEGLEQRVRLYSKFQEEAEKDGNEALADKHQKIVSVYMNAIKTFRRGGYVDVLRLPNPNGCPPIPIPFYAD